MGVYTIVVKDKWSGCFVNCGAFGVLIIHMIITYLITVSMKFAIEYIQFELKEK